MRLFILCVAATSLAAPVDIEPAEGQLKIQPESVEIKTFYSGAPVEIGGTATSGSDVVLVIRGPDKEETFNKKVRAGPIWINSGQVHVSGVPSLFLSFSPASVRSLLPPEKVDQYLLDTEAIRNEIHLDAGGEEIDGDVIRTNYLSLKTNDEIYQVHNRTEELKVSQTGEFTLAFHWPGTAPPATYEVAAYECRDGAIVTKSTGVLRVEKVGLPADLYNFAMERARIYGGFAVLFAVIAGFGIDFLMARLFGAKPRGGH